MGNPPKWYDSHLPEFRETAHIRGPEEYKELYTRSLEDADAFWSQNAREYLTWAREWDFVMQHDVRQGRVEWFGGGKLNACFNCLDRHVARHPHRIAYYREGNGPSNSRIVTYSKLLQWVNKLSAFLKSRDISRGQRVVIYMPNMPELPAAMLACARIGAVHVVIHPGYSAHWLAERIQECEARILITANTLDEGERITSLREKALQAVQRCPEVETVVVCDRDARQRTDKEVGWHDIMSDPHLPAAVPSEPMSSEDPLFIMFTGGNTGKPKGLVHTHGGYLLWAAMTTRLIFDLREDDLLWCTSDLAWITGHTLSVYGALINGVSSVICDRGPDSSVPDRYWKIIERLRVTKLCTEPTTIRTLSSFGTEPLKKHDLSSLRILGTSGEPLAPELWHWLYDHVGGGRCPIIDAWWQAESGGPMMAPLPGVHPLKPGSVVAPFLGVVPIILDLNTGDETKFPNQEGAFFIGRPWPGIARTVLGDHAGYMETYFAPFENLFITGDGAKVDEDGYYWMTGRIDDVINAGGHRIGAWEIENALAAHPDVAEAVVVGFPHPRKGQGLYAFVTLSSGPEMRERAQESLSEWLDLRIGPLAVPDVFQWAEELPKTRSGKILRRLLQRIAAGQIGDLGDTTTVANPASLDKLIADARSTR